MAAWLLTVFWASATSSLAQTTSSPDSEFYKNSYALVIGISDYKHKDVWKRLDNAFNDAQKMAEFLEKSGFIVTPLYNDKADAASIRREIRILGEKLEKEDRVLIYFAGHGHTQKWAGGQELGFIVPYDGTAESDTFISMDNLREFSGRWLGTAKHQLFIMDSCYGGSLAPDNLRKSLSTGTSAKKLDNEKLREMTQPAARLVLTAGKKDEPVVDDGGARKGHSLFTSELLFALQDARADFNNDGFITFSELWTYIQGGRASKSEQTPHKAELAGHEDGREFVFISRNSIRRKVLIDPVMEPQDASKEPNIPVQQMGVLMLLKDLQEQQVWTVDFRLAGSSDTSRMRSGSSAGEALPQGDLEADYRLRFTYLPLDKERIRVQAYFQPRSADLPHVEVPPMTVSARALDFKALAEAIVARFAPAANLRLHLDSLKVFPPGELENHVRTAIESWLESLSLPRIQYEKEKSGDTSADVDLMLVAFVTTEGGREVFKLQAFIRRPKEAPRQFESRKVAPTAWNTAWQELQKQIEEYLAEISKKL